jgi:hypothetical protein
MPKAGDNHHHHIAQHVLLLRLVHLTTWFIQASAQGTTKKGKRTSFGALLIIGPLVCCEFASHTQHDAPKQTTTTHAS